MTPRVSDIVTKELIELLKNTYPDKFPNIHSMEEYHFLRGQQAVISYLKALVEEMENSYTMNQPKQTTENVLLPVNAQSSCSSNANGNANINRGVWATGNCDRNNRFAH